MPARAHDEGAVITTREIYDLARETHDAVMGVQADITALKIDITALTATQITHGGRLDSLERVRMYATGAVGVLGVLVGWLAEWAMRTWA